MKKITFILSLLLVFSTIGYSQVSGYGFTETTETYAQITGTTSTAIGDDGSQNTIDIGFTFNFGGVDYTTFSVNTNGFIRLGNTITTGSFTNALGNAAAYRPLIAPFWDDNHLSTGTIRYSLTGSAPNQVLTVNWHDMKVGGGGSTAGPSVSMLLRLYETSNIIEFVYGSPFTTTNTVTASVGLNDMASFLSVTPAVTSTVSSATANNGITAAGMANLAGKKLIFSPPSCPAPTNVVVSNVTTTTADFSWTQGGSEFDWEYLILPAGSPAPTGSGNDIASDSFTESGLSPATAYAFWIRAYCSFSDQSNWVGPFNFTTPCDSFNTFPFTETFEVASPSRTCWSNLQVAGAANWTYATGSSGGLITTAFEGTLNARFVSVSGTNTPITKLVSPVFDMSTLTNPRLKFHYAQEVWFGDQNELKVYYRISSTDPWVEIAHYTANVTAWTEVILTLPNPSATYQIAFEGINNFGRANVVDNVIVEETPSCAEPTGLSVTNITATTATINWGATTGDYEYVLDNDAALPSGDGASISGESFDATSLTPSTVYYFHVRTDCSGTFSNWSTIMFRTPPANDECTGAVSLTVNPDYSCGIVTAGTIVGATASPQADDVTGTPDNDVWYSFVATSTAHRISLINLVAVTGFSTDMGIGLYDGTSGCSSLVLVGSSDPETYNVTGLTIGNTYIVRVYGWGNGPTAQQVNFNICIGTQPPPPANDTCATAIPVDCSDVVVGSTANGATDTGNNASADVWYSYSGAAGDITASLCTNTSFDTIIRVFDSCGGTQIAVNDDSCGLQSSVTFAANGTSTYYIMVEGFGTATGNFELTVTCVLNANSFDNNNFMVYPNPVKNVLNLSYTSEISTVRVMNMLGQEVISRNLNSATAQVDMSQLSAGTYIVNVTIGDTVKTIKVVKQ